MVKNHIKRIRAPKTWRIMRKSNTFITKPNPGAHNQSLGLSINTFLKEVVFITKTTKETKYLLTKQKVIVNGKRIRDDKHSVGFLDIVSVPSAKKTFRVIVDSTGNIASKEVKDGENKLLLKITGKAPLKKDIFQINTMSGRNLIVKTSEAKKYKVGDSLIISVPDNKIEKHISTDKGSHVFVFTGKHCGKTGSIEESNSKTVKIKTKSDSFETSKDYMITIGKDKSEFDIAE